ncbi:dnaJ homolog subfamily B member 13-like [Cynoglossus semilaevis]|uniref:DnaJ heat shock protein family (Hsp40) member B13 n=1 Tax=Cynoglossus semilaevis TaxID=244447 RepID=A0A3P8W9M7_CYNSE|nr:dnaJ homolog subfamily B member 13-like [Cynoglossus semilaevis]
MAVDFYATLNLNRNATDGDIKKAYRRLALKFHPCNCDEAESRETFTHLGEAYDVLSDPRKRATFDKFGEEGLRDGLPPELGNNQYWSNKYTYHGNPEKTFREFFGGNNPFADLHSNAEPLMLGGLRRAVIKPQDPSIERELFLSLSDLFHGGTKKIRISRRVMNEDGHMSSIKDKILSIDVSPGWKEGARIVFSKEGDQGPNNVPADVVFIVRQKSHPLFKRQDDDLLYMMQISLEMALTGFSLEVETLDGRLLRIPINDIVHPSYTKVVTGEGMPLLHSPSQRGNLVITFDIDFPKKLSFEQKLLIKKALK